MKRKEGRTPDVIRWRASRVKTVADRVGSILTTGFWKTPPVVEEEVEEEGEKGKDAGQETEDAGQKTEDAGQKTKDAGQKTEDAA